MLPPFKPGQSIDAYLEQMSNANTVQLIDMERRGVPHAFVAALSERMAVPLTRMQKLMRISKATAARKRGDENSLIGGAAGTTATAIVKLMGMAQRMVNQSTSPDAQGFDVQKWFGAWIDLPQPALDGKKPSELLDTPSGVEAVARVLGALESGAYQ
ncbi:MAG: MbcA/ParS/Xre antitoxin family protein [Burkholderiaceae bacterium]|jgi:putative toxin-antitoxin system antitoxin component (TIGR02293 family)|nr:MbcA/ParS/Xre antitoxin family protein [Burkholderiaceae bacterium]